MSYGGTTDPNYDYTRDTGNGGGGGGTATISADDYEIADVAAHAKTADQLANENGFRDIPPGEHRLVVHGFAEPPKEGYFTVLVKGEKTSITANMIRVRLSLENDSRAQITDFFTLPPANPAMLDAYYNGVPADKPDSNPGFAANKFYHFMGALGYEYPPGGHLPVEARRLGNWKGRKVIATVKAGTGTYVSKKDGSVVPNGPQLKLFSYRKADGPLGAVGVASTVGGAPYTPPASAFRQPDSAQVAPASVTDRRAAVGLDTI